MMALDRKWIAREMDRWKVRGLSVVTVREGSEPEFHCLGSSDPAGSHGTNLETRYPIASLSKAFTALSVGILVDRGEIGWDDKVADHWPDAPFESQAWFAHATFRDLLLHRVGLPLHNLYWVNSTRSFQALASDAVFLTKTRSFRERARYQNITYLLAGYLVEKISGLSWREFLRKSVLDPLAMTRTGFGLKGEVSKPSFARAQSLEGGTWKPAGLLNVDSILPAAGLVSNITDMGAWIGFFLDRGKASGKTVVDEKIVHELIQPQAIPEGNSPGKEGPVSGFGMGWVSEMFRGHHLVCHTGATNGNCLAGFIPDKKTGVAVLSNALPDNPICRIVAYQALGSTLGLEPFPWSDTFREKTARIGEDYFEGQKKIRRTYRKTGTRPSHDLAEYAGEYRNPQYGKIEITVQRGGLRAALNGIRYHLEHFHFDQFEFDCEMGGFGGLLSFHYDNLGRIQSVLIPLEPAVDDLCFLKIK